MTMRGVRGAVMLSADDADEMQEAVLELLTEMMVRNDVSFDDFIIAFFVAGSETTLPIYIFSSIRRGITPEVNAIGTMVMVASLILLVIAQLILRRGAKK